VGPTYQRRPRTRSLPLPLPLPGGTGLSAPILSRTRSFPLSVRWARSISVDRPFALAGSRTPPVSHLPFTNLPPALSAVDMPTTRISRPLPHAPDPFSRARTHSLTTLAQLCPQQTPSLLSLAPHTHLWSSVVVRRPFRARLRASVTFVASVSFASSPATRDTLWFAPSLSVSPGPRSPAFSPCSRSSAAIDPRLPCVLAVAQALKSPLSR
jgi:hypothetical protein